MTLFGHLRLALLATVVWAGFWVLGLPSYYQQYSDTFMLVFDLALLIGILVWLPRVFRRIRPGRRVKLALWMSFYFTVPLAVYDGAYCGVYLGHGWEFAWRYWYLSIYYVIPWIAMPAVAAAVEHREASIATCGLG